MPLGFTCRQRSEFLQSQLIILAVLREQFLSYCLKLLPSLHYNASANTILKSFGQHALHAQAAIPIQPASFRSSARRIVIGDKWQSTGTFQISSGVSQLKPEDISCLLPSDYQQWNDWELNQSILAFCLLPSGCLLQQSRPSR